MRINSTSALLCVTIVIAQSGGVMHMQTTARDYTEILWSVLEFK